jgi:hypothetical protein
MAIGRPIEQTPNIADKVVTATATAGQTQFTVTGGYRINHLAVFRNGVRLVNGNDYTALDGTTITLMEDASNLDVLEFQVFDTFSVSDALLTNAASQTVNGDVTVNGAFTVGSGGIGTFTAAEVVVGIVSSTTGITTVKSVQAASSTTTGALQVKGGVGIGKSLYVGGNVSVGGTLTYEDVTNVDSVGLVTAGKGVRITTGGLVVTAGVSTFAGITTVTNTAALHSKQLNVSAGSTFGGAVTANDTLTVAGNLDIADTIYHTGDSNTKIRFPAADTFSVETGGSERVRVNDTGMGVGITPVKKFNVVAGIGSTEVIRLSQPVDSSVQQEFGIGWCSNNSHVWPGAQITSLEYDISDSRRGMLFYTRGTNQDIAPTERMRITSDGSIGIGTHDPDHKLEVFNGAIKVDRRDTTASGDPHISLRTGASGGSRFEIFGSGVSDDNSNWIFKTNANEEISFRIATTEIMHLQSSKVGIGTTIADGSLHVYQSSAGSVTAAGDANELVLESATNVGMSFLTANDSLCRIKFGDPDATNAGIIVYSHADNSMRFATNDGSERMRINSSGYIGIGAANPVGNLEIRDSSKANLIVAKDGLTVKNNSDLASNYDFLQIGAGGALASYNVETATASTYLIHNAYRDSSNNWNYRYADTSMRLRMNSPGRAFIFESAASGSANANITYTESLRIDAAGNVGIGTNDPVDNLHILDTIPRIVLEDSDSGNATVFDFDSEGTGGSPTFNLKGGGTGFVKVTSTGKIGISSESPGYKVDICNPGSSDGIRILQSGNNYATFIADCNRSGDDNAILYMRGRWDGTEVCRISLETGDDTTNKDNGQIKFWTKHSSATDIEEILEINESGQVSIYGTAQEASLLRLYPTNAQTTPSIDIRSNCNSSCGNILRFYDEDTSVAASKALGDIQFWSQDSGNAGVKAAIQGAADSATPNGELRFQTDNNQTLSTAMRINYQGYVQFPMMGDAGGTNAIITSGGYLQKDSSSRRYKKNIKSIEDSMADKMLECRPVWFQKNSEEDDSLGHYGFIAEEVNEIDPTFVVFENERDGIDENGNPVWKDQPKEKWLPESVKYTNFVPLLLNLAKRQKAQIESLEKRLTELESK